MEKKIFDYENEIKITTFDGLILRGSFQNSLNAESGVVLIHGSGADRHEDGFFDQLVNILNKNKIATLRIDIRGHGISEGKREWVTLSSTINDIHAAIIEMRNRISKVHLLACSFTGGAAALLSTKQKIESLILINPILNYLKRYFEDKNFVNGNKINSEKARHLNEQGWIDHFGVLRLTRYFFNELPWIDPNSVANLVGCPILLIHGTLDKKAPIEISENWISRAMKGRIVKIAGADHQITEPGDKEFKKFQTRKWHQEIIELTTNWVKNEYMTF